MYVKSWCALTLVKRYSATEVGWNMIEFESSIAEFLQREDTGKFYCWGVQ